VCEATFVQEFKTVHQLQPNLNRCLHSELLELRFSEHLLEIRAILLQYDVVKTVFALSIGHKLLGAIN
jgi:hypothetical protein